MKNKLTILLATALCAGACSFLEVEPKVIEGGSFYKSESEVKGGLAGIYGALTKEPTYGNYYSLMISGGDDLMYFNRPSTNTYIHLLRHDAGSTEIYDAWTCFYKGIDNANSFMEAMQGNELDKEGKYYNEARFLRAYFHFILAQAWGDVPLRSGSVKNYAQTMCPATAQYDVLKWVAEEMEACIKLADESFDNCPSRINKWTIHGILSRVYLFMAGESIEASDRNKAELFGKARQHADAVIKSQLYQLNKVSYEQVFINMIMDIYDRESCESMWEADFLGHREDAANWSNSRIGDEIGLQSPGADKYETFKCNFANARYNASLKLWNLYWSEDRTDDEKELNTVTDRRQEWNMPWYNYNGNAGLGLEKSIDKTPYGYSGSGYTSNNPISARGKRNCGKWRREVEYEGQLTAKMQYTNINFPILRYADVLLMYAEADLESTGTVNQDAFDCVKLIRDRAGIKTRDMGEYDAESFRQLIRNERGRELCFEALRKYDLIRWGIYEQEMKKYVDMAKDENVVKDASIAGYYKRIGEAVQHKHIVLPIPSIELGSNTELHQNKLW